MTKLSTPRMTHGIAQRIRYTLLSAAAVVGMLTALFASSTPAFAVMCDYNPALPGVPPQASCACPTSGSGVDCFNGQLFRASDASCQNDTRATCTASQMFNCDTTACQCDTTQFPCGGCTAATSTPGALVNPGIPQGQVYTNQCSAVGCPAGKSYCSTSGTPNYQMCITPGSCPAGQTYDVCLGACVGNLIVYLQATPTAQGASTAANAAVAINGNLKLDGSGASQGDIFMANGKAIQVNGTGTTSLSIGNWGAGTTGVTTYFDGNVNLSNRATTGMSVFNTADQTVNFERGFARWSSNVFTVGTERGGTGVARNLSLLANGYGITFPGATAATMQLTGSNANGYYIYPGTDVGVYLAGNLTNRTNRASVNLSNVSGASFNAAAGTQTNVLIDGVVRQTGTAGFDTLTINPTFTTAGTGRSTLIRAQDGGTDRFVVARNGWVAAGSKAGALAPTSPVFPMDISSNASWAIERIADDSAAGTLWTGVRLDRPYNTEKWFLGMAASDNSFVIRKDSATNIMTVATDGDTTINGTTFNADNSMTVNGPVTFNGPVTYGSGGAECSMPTVVGATPGSYTGLVTGPGVEKGYVSANARCNAAGGAMAGSHVCSPDEVLRSIGCNETTAFLAAGNSVWVANGPPGFTNPKATDCNGFTIAESAISGIYGAVWTFDTAANGFGYGAATTCAASNKILCCK